MLIDWFTVAAQALNFAILIWLMKRFLYKPVLDAIDARERLIAAKLADAEAKQAQARQQRDEFEGKTAAFDQERAGMMSKATEEANGERLRLLDEASRAADAVTAKRQDTLRADASALNRAIAERAQKEVFAIVREALVGLAGASLEERICEVFVARLRALDGPAKDSLSAAVKSATGPALIRTAFDLSEAQQAAIRLALDQIFSADVLLRFDTSPDLVAGIELAVNGQKLDWSIAHYIASLEKSVDELLRKPASIPPAAEVGDVAADEPSPTSAAVMSAGTAQPSPANA